MTRAQVDRTWVPAGQVDQPPTSRSHRAARAGPRTVANTVRTWAGPAAGAAIIAANHLSFFDSVVLALAVPRRLSFVGKAEYLDSWKTRRLFPALEMIPVDRDSPRRAYGALQVAAGLLDVEADELFAAYPEGTRSPDGSLRDGRNGVGHLSVTTGAAIIPTGIVGTDRIQPCGARLPRPFRTAVVRFGAPIEPGGYDSTRRDRRRRITRDVMSAIGQLSGQTSTGRLTPVTAG